MKILALISTVRSLEVIHFTEVTDDSLGTSDLSFLRGQTL